MSKPHKHQKLRAFSLIEIAAIILIIGILIAGVFTGISLMKKARIQAAQTLTKSSPIATISSNALWLETSLEDSIDGSQSNDGNSVTNWTDQKLVGSKSSITAVGTGPTYANTINHIHAVKFSETVSDTNYLKIADASFLNGTDYTIVVLEKRQIASAGNFLSTTDSSDVVDDKLAIGYASDGVIAHSHNSTNYTVTPKVGPYASSSETPRLFVFTQSSTEGKKTYINGTLAAQDTSNTSQLSGVTTLAIGKGYTGEIGEIAIFTKALGSLDRKIIEDYLAKKWTRKLNRSAVSIGSGDTSGNPSCISGTVTDSASSGCDNSCTVGVTGVSTPNSVPDGASDNLTCDSSLGYSGTVSYSCSNGDLHPIGSCNAITCTAAAGSGYAAQSGLPYATSGSGSFNCDSSTGYSGTKNYTCTAVGAATITGGTCTAITCTTGAGTGYSAQSNLPYAASGSGSFNCDSSAGYIGTINYTCTSPGAATNISGNCTSTCSITTVAGITSGTKVAVGSTSTNCNATGYNTANTINYTCSNGNVFNLVSGSCSCATNYALIGGTCTAVNNCTGGTTSTISGYKIHTFTASGVFSCTFVANSAIEVLVVAGGGSGATGRGELGGGGGGGGGVVYANGTNGKYPITANTPYTVTVGAGGNSVQTTRSTAHYGNSGADSAFGTLLAKGGGGGSGDTSINGLSGGSGGGSSGQGGAGGSTIQSSAGNQVNATVGYGNRGGNGLNPDPYAGGGGGGANQIGSSGTSSAGGNGGNGIGINITGTTVYYGAGGGGACGRVTGTNAVGGLTGGGGGRGAGNSVDATGGTTPGSGGGGSGGGATSGSGYNYSGAGAKGVVIVRYPYSSQVFFLNYSSLFSSFFT